MEIFGSKFLLLLVFANLISLSARAAPTHTELQLDIALHLSKKGEVREVQTADRRVECTALTTALSDELSHGTHSFEATTFERSGRGLQTYLVCVGVEANGNYMVEYFPED